MCILKVRNLKEWILKYSYFTDGRASHMGERGGATNNGGDLSPTSNQLARWFSPELLERARAGMVPNMPSATAAQHAINLEEIERQTAPPVHN